MKRETTNTASLSTKEPDSQLPKRLGAKTYQELGITPQQWIDLAESLLISREFVSALPHGELATMHRMKIDYLEKYFGIQQGPSILNPLETNQE